MASLFSVGVRTSSFLVNTGNTASPTATVGMVYSQERRACLRKDVIDDVRLIRPHVARRGRYRGIDAGRGVAPEHGERHLIRPEPEVFLQLARLAGGRPAVERGREDGAQVGRGR